MSNAESHKRYIERLRSSRRNLKLISPSAAEIIAIAARVKNSENQASMDRLIEHATEIWNLAQVANSPNI